jgi:hypothetical protein
LKSYPHPKNIRHLATLTTYAFACEQANIAFNGNQICTHFAVDPAVRSGLFNKHLNGMKPSPETLTIIDRKAKGTLSVFYSPIWDALELLEQKDADTFAILEKQDLDVLALLFKSERDYDRSFISKSITTKTILDLRRLSTESALAALIMLRQEKKNASQLPYIPKVFLDRVIYSFLINLLACDVLPYTYYAKYCFEFLSDTFNWESTIFTKKPFREALVRENVMKRREQKSMLTKFRRSWAVEEYMMLLNRMDEGNRKLIEAELAVIQNKFSESNAFELSKIESHGLYWALAKINRISSDIDKFKLRTDGDKYVLKKIWS